MLTNVSPHVKLYSLCPLFFPRFPSTSPLKPIPCPAPAKAPSSIKKRPSFRDKEAFFRFRSIKKQEKETQVCIWILKIWCIIKTSPISCFQGKMPVYSFKFEVWSKCKKKRNPLCCGGGSCSFCAFQENVDPALQSEGENQPVGEEPVQRRELTVEDEQEIWRDITLTQYKHTHWTKIRAFTSFYHRHLQQGVLYYY